MADDLWGSVNQPQSLWTLCLQYCTEHLHCLATYDKSTKRYVLREGLKLPLVVCESLLKEYQNTFTLTDSFLHIFADNQRTILQRQNLTDGEISDEGLTWMLRHSPNELKLSGCSKLTSGSLVTLNANGQQIQTLQLGDCTQIFDGLENIVTEGGDENTSLLGVHNGLKCPNLRALSVHSLQYTNSDGYNLPVSLPQRTKLRVLDISNCRLDFVETLEDLDSLVTLILYNVNVGDFGELVQSVSRLKQLRVLDVSQHEDSPVHYTYPDAHLEQLVSNLPHLRRLDLSGTNLPVVKREVRSHRPGKALQPDELEERPCPIPVLEGRHFEFLGLMNCADDPSHCDNLPADQVTGDANEAQVLLSLQTYMDRPFQLLPALNNLFNIFKFQVCHHQGQALQVILVAMKRHPEDKHIQISGSASLFYIVKGKDKYRLTSHIKRRIVRAILDGIERHMEENTMLRNGCLTLCHFNIPQDVLFSYERVVRVLLAMVAPPQHEEFVQRIGIYLLNSLACQVDGQEKRLVGNLGAVTTMLDIVKNRLVLGQCDEILEIAWSTMWNVTDETTENCEKFLNQKGMQLFLKCLKEFPDKDELLRNMMGLMGNVAEVECLRHRLMEKDYVQIFSDLLDSSSDGIEVSYNACGVLAHLVSDGKEAWTVRKPVRKDVLAKMVAAIDRWNLNTKRNINYRSFGPILRLLNNYTAPEAQHWAVWALANLTLVYKEKYCVLVQNEGGLEMLRRLVEHPHPNQKIKDLARQVITRCEEGDMPLDG